MRNYPKNMHNTFASTSMILINPIYYWSQSVTNLITVLFPWGLWIDKFIHKSDDLRKFMYELPNILSNFSHLNSSELLILPFKYSLKMFNYNVILNFKCSSFSSAKIWANLDAAILFCSRHNNLTFIFKGQLFQI